jgi:hypothetical protein
VYAAGSFAGSKIANKLLVEQSSCNHGAANFNHAAKVMGIIFK